ncbi:MAG: undecaprenyldiphospho-muramoylpentapeptide beta-N-acetylglucosaminyltransferase [Clostridia bacterium]|nr:undecaprenyldiphospho-muramoylpentapeptide beta-N-acetylglucosaminyltransferase [Clostridia bacterium]
MRVIITCAGSGGHINPAIAIANLIKYYDKQSEILFIGTATGLENDLVKKAGYNLKQIRAGRLHRRVTLENVKNIKNAFLGIGDSKKIIREFQPDVAIGTGGYICVSVMKAAQKLKIPYILHESNVFPGMSVRLNAKHASKILLGFNETNKHLPNANCIYTGTPAKFNKDSIDALNKLKCKNDLKLNIKGKKILFVTGGSQGAQKINETVIDMVKKYKPQDFFVVIAVGRSNYETVCAQVSDDIKEYIRVEEFIYEMDKMYKASDLLITRAGAMTVLELEIAAKPAILIPLPTAAENHQLYNAKSLEDNNAGFVLEEKDLDVDVLFNKIQKLVSDEKLLKNTGANARKLLKENVEQSILEEIIKTVKGEV